MTTQAIPIETVTHWYWYPIRLGADFIESYYFVVVMLVITIAFNVMEAQRRSKLAEHERKEEDR